MAEPSTLVQLLQRYARVAPPIFPVRICTNGEARLVYVGIRLQRAFDVLPRGEFD